MTQMTPAEKRATLARYTEILVMTGYDIRDLFATPLSHFDYDYIKKHIAEYEAEQEAENNRY